jgi:hypothetical protein
MGWMTRIQFLAESGIFSSPLVSRLALGPTQPPFQWVPEALSPGVKHLGLETDYSPPSSTEDENTWSYICTLPYIYVAWFLIKQRVFTFTLHCYSLSVVVFIFICI